ncbi:MAG: hypothetical protein ISR76_01180 [Planctomycetes bacterium]|nr:hypothetical protein [Planctomycetota bacterium]MBL7007581.1 hypothetical protein [Planctomycetota bacterium]
MPPAIAWAPADLPEDSAWSRLLDSFLGIYLVTSESEVGELLLEDLWSGQALRWAPDQPLPALGPAALVVGRFVLGAEGMHETLPGTFTCSAAGLPEAVERDLNAIRAGKPRSRLSQLECERLFAPLLAASEPVSDGRVAAAASFAALGRVLGDLPPWAAGGWEQALAAFGPAELLDRIAFETSADLEMARRLVFELSGDPGGVSRAAPAEAPACPAAGGRPDPALALRLFDQQRKGGAPVEECFLQLEVALGLEPGASHEEDDGAAVGPPGPPTFQALQETYRWEREAESKPLQAAEAELLGALGAFLQELRTPEQQSTLVREQVLAFLLQAPGEEAVRRLSAELAPFLRWSDRELEEGTENLVQDLEAGLGNKLAKAAACNHELKRTGGRAAGSARVVSVEPLRVAAADGEEAVVNGVPERFRQWMEDADLLQGTWRSGEFDAAGWIPKEVLGPSLSD